MMHTDLAVWKQSIALVKLVYRITADFPESEKFGLVSQMRRCAVSIPSNIAEGAARDSSREFVRFLTIAIGSLAELETQLFISSELGFSTDSEPVVMIEQVRKLLFGLKRSVNK